MELLNFRLRRMCENRNKLQQDIDTRMELSRQSVARMNELKPEQKRLARERDDLKKFVLFYVSTSIL